MIKLPEPIGATYTIAGIQHCTITQVLPDANLYTEDQLKKAVRDALEESEKVAQKTVCDTHIPTGINIYGTRAAKAIRALIKEIDP